MSKYRIKQKHYITRRRLKQGTKNWDGLSYRTFVVKQNVYKGKRKLKFKAL